MKHKRAAIAALSRTHRTPFPFVGRGIPDAPPVRTRDTPHPPNQRVATSFPFVGRGFPDAPPVCIHNTPHPKIGAPHQFIGKYAKSRHGNGASRMLHPTNNIGGASGSETSPFPSRFWGGKIFLKRVSEHSFYMIESSQKAKLLSGFVPPRTESIKELPYGKRNKAHQARR